MLKKIFFSYISFSMFFVMGMENFFISVNILRLLENDAKTLNKLLQKEKQGEYVPDLLEIEKPLQEFSQKIDTLSLNFSDNAKYLISLMGQRSNDREKLKKAFSDSDHQTIKDIIHKNPLMLNARGFAYSVLEKYETLLHYAVKKQQIEPVKLLLELGANASSIGAAGNTPLHHSNIIPEIALLLIQYKANIHQKNDCGKTPLHTARNFSVIKFLLHSGALINEIDNEGHTVLSAYTQNALDDCNEEIEYLLNLGADPLIKDNKGHTVFALAALNNSPCVKTFEHYGLLCFPCSTLTLHNDILTLLRNNAKKLKKLYQSNFNEKYTLAQYEAENNLARLFKTIKRHNTFFKLPEKERGITIYNKGYEFKQCSFENLCNLFGRKAVRYAHNVIKSRYLQIINFLSSNISLIKEKLYYIPALFEYYQHRHGHLLITAIINNNFKGLKQLLRYQIDPNCSYKNMTALQTSIINNKPEAISLLIAYDADFSQHTNNNQPPLELACSSPDKSACKQALKDACAKKLLTIPESTLTIPLIQHFLDHGVDINAKDNDGFTLLHKIIHSVNHRDEIIFLLNNGADVHTHSDDGVSILQSSFYETSGTILQLLLDYGAVVNLTLLKLVPQAFPFQVVKKIVEDAYNNQACCICHEHPTDLGIIPCQNKHIKEFLCKKCYNATELCPLCNDKLLRK